ncbi:MAG: sulfur carrier protein ThiS [Alphaproteobacteria bacterium]
MKIMLNGERQTLENKHTIEKLLERNGYNGKLVAVALNGEFLPKTNYATTEINDGDKIEIVAPMQGG